MACQHPGNFLQDCCHCFSSRAKVSPVASQLLASVVFVLCYQNVAQQRPKYRDGQKFRSKVLPLWACGMFTTFFDKFSQTPKTQSHVRRHTSSLLSFGPLRPLRRFHNVQVFSGSGGPLTKMKPLGPWCVAQYLPALHCVYKHNYLSRLEGRKLCNSLFFLRVPLTAR